MSDPAAREGRKPNRLARETSPYLLQHAHNPVDWYPWGEEAFARARAENKPILLSVGYATCHWCHVMERESFEDEAIAALLARHFIAIKVDREELPDVDHVYMSALQTLTGHGGWPMNMFLTPALEPFYGGTYFPPIGRPGLPSFADVLSAVAAAWRDRREELAGNARALLSHARQSFGDETRGNESRPDPLRVHAEALATLAGSFDPDWGGFGAAPKFPQPPLLQYLLALAAGGSARARTMLLETLHRMAQGGIYDQVGGGFARYSTDRRWHVPHFEKMLYDNVQLVRVYAGAWRLTGDTRLRFVAEDTLAYLQREMRQPQASAAFSSAQDADAEGVEGRFHVWTLAQMREVLGDDTPAAARLYGATDAGNWAQEGEPGQNVLERRDPEAVRAELGMDEAAFARWEQSVRERLYAARSARAWPITDDKVLADWNAMALRALAESGRLLERDDLVAHACAIAEFVLGTMTVNGLPRHAWREGQLREQAYLSDAVQLALGLLELNAATGEPRWALRAAELAQRAIDTFHEAGRGFVDAPAGVLPLAARDRFDGATPSAISSVCELLIRLAPVFDRPDWATIAREEIARGAGLAARAPSAVPALLMAMLLDSHGGELARVNGADALAPGEHAFAPLVTVVAGAPDSLPLFAQRKAGEAYLCRQSHCELPARDESTLATQVAALHALRID